MTPSDFQTHYDCQFFSYSLSTQVCDLQEAMSLAYIYYSYF